MKEDAMRVALTVAGSDSGGGAGIQADLKTFHAFGVFGTSALTAVTAQNTNGVSGVVGLDPEFVQRQIRSVLSDLNPHAIKTGMLFSAGIIEAVRELLEPLTVPLVVDPVMVATSGDRLLAAEAENALASFLESAYLITPNLPEAEVLLDSPIETLDDMQDAATRLGEKTGACVLLKGGHRLVDPDRPGDAVDILYQKDSETGQDITVFARPMVETRSTHGTGCTLSSAIAACLARGIGLHESIRRAKEYVSGAIKHAPGLGKGNGPLNHMWRDLVRA